MNQKYFIYLDVCCLNRPFDDWSQSRVRLEAEAVLAIMTRCQIKDWYLLNSTVLESEIAQTPDITKLERVMKSLSVAESKILVTDAIAHRVSELTKLSFKFYDALHLACAESGNADIFLTTDERLRRKAVNYENELKVRVANPVFWLMEITN